MPTETNPYSSPNTSSQGSTLSPDIAGETGNHLPGRTGVWIIGGSFSLFALLSLLAFVYQLGYTLPTGESFVRTNPIWVFSHLVRGVGLSILSWQLFHYAGVIGRIATLEDIQHMSQRHAALWNWGAIVMLAIAGYAILTTMFAFR